MAHLYKQYAHYREVLTYMSDIEQELVLMSVTQVPRTSALQAPVMELSGHSGEVFCAKFENNGNYIASGSMDRSISEDPPISSLRTS